MGASEREVRGAQNPQLKPGRALFIPQGARNRMFQAMHDAPQFGKSLPFPLAGSQGSLS